MSTRVTKIAYGDWLTKTQSAYDKLTARMHKAPQASFTHAHVVGLYKAHLSPTAAARELVDGDGAGFAAGLRMSAEKDSPEQKLFDQWMKARRLRDQYRGTNKKKYAHYYDLADQLQYRLEDISLAGREMIWAAGSAWRAENAPRR